VRLAIGPGLQDVTSFDGLTWRGTIQTKINSWLLLEPGFDINTESGSGGRLKPGVNKIADYAAFLLADITALKTLNLRPGVRVLKNSAYNAPPAVASLNAKYTINRVHDLRMAYGRGFRAPSLRELHFNFFDASHSIEGNPDLEAELSHSINGSWNWSLNEKGSWQIISVLSGFYNSVDNMIATGVLPGSTNTTYINIENYQTQGGTLGITAKKSQFDISMGYGYTGRLNRFAGQNPNLPNFTWTGEVTAIISHFLPKAGLRSTVNYKYTGKTPFYEVVRNSENSSIIQLAETDGFHWADFSIQKNLWTYLTVMFGIRNMFDIQRINSTAQAGEAHSSSGPRPIGYGRSYYASVTFDLFD
jgi:outer membrane receptor for ferrienterochelin and colicins